MGNNLVAYTPSQILTIDSCLHDLPNYKNNKSLGSTRFMKVACASCTEGWVVLKVFILPDVKFNLDVHKTEILRLSTRLKKSSNCLPFQTFHITDKAAVLVRQYVKHNLYDRLSTRPFYNTIERKWVAFQLLCALNQMTKCNVCHGDIKSENVLLTSWNWLLLTDFACYKPVELPYDNPANFNYFYDTARRRSCYIAPERFSESFIDGESNSSGATLTQENDIFSAGCVIAELFTDGRRLFDLSQLLAYKSGTYSPEELLSKIQDESIRDLIRDMIQLDPSKRKTANQYLQDYHENIFPVIFYRFLKAYLGKFCELPLKTADETIEILFNDQKIIFEEVRKFRDGSSAIVVLSSLLLSCIRKLKYCVTKLKALDLISKFVFYLPDEFIVERVLPYLMHMLKDLMARTRAKVLATIALCLSQVREMPMNEVTIFSEYILPEINPCATDSEVLVRQSYAENIAIFAKRAAAFIDQVKEEQSKPQTDDSQKVEKSLLDFELKRLSDVMQSKIQVVMSDTESTTRLILLQSAMTELCTFFGRRRADDVVLSHMITVLNDKHDWQLRAAFFSTMVSVCTFIGWQSSYFLKPLLEQGLNDSEEFVVAETLSAIRKLVVLGLLPKELMLELVEEHVAYLAHPCQWIRLNMVGLVSACASILTPVDNHCFLRPMLSPYMQREVLQTKESKIVLSALQPHLRNDIYNTVCGSKDVSNFFTTLKARSKFEHTDDTSPTSAIKQHPLEQKLKGKDVSKYEKMVLLKLEKHVGRRQEASKYQSEKDEERDGSEINLQQIIQKTTKNIRRHAVLRGEGDQLRSRNSASRKGGQGTEPQEMSEEWRHMFGNSNAKPPSQQTSQMPQNISNQPISMSQLETTATMLETAQDQQQPNAKTAVPPAHNQALKYTKCMSDLRLLVHHKRAQHRQKLERKRLDEFVDNRSQRLSKPWKPKGILITKMTEHRGCINKVLVGPSNEFFVTASSDRTLKLWEWRELERKMVVNRSRATCSHFGGAIQCLTFCGDADVVCSSEDGALHHINLNKMSARLAEKPDFEAATHTPVVKKVPINKTECGNITDIGSLFGSRLIVYVTSHGHIVAIDTRTWKPAYKFKQHSKHGLPTALCTDYGQNWLCTGTSHGTHVCWDLRFRLPISTFTHPSRARVRKLTTHPANSQSLISVVNGNNEVTMWDIETGTRQMALWGSNTPVFSLTHKSSDSVNGMDVQMTNEGLQVFTGGNDGRVRLWDVQNHDECQIVCGPERNVTSRNNYKVWYESRLVEGTQVIQEHISKIKRTTTEATSFGATNSASDGHDDFFSGGRKRKPGEHNVPVHNRDVISDLAIYNANQPLLVTTTSTGVVALWK